MSNHLSHAFCRCCLPLLIMGTMAVSASAEGNGGKRDHAKRKPAHREVDHVRAFKEADTNEDGFLSSEEFAQMKRLARLSPDKRERIFAFLDKNKDGKLHHRELHPTAPARLAPLLKHFGKLDADGSGGISFEELRKARVFKEAPGGHIKQLFQRLDRNKNGQLELNELDKVEHRSRPTFQFDKHDTDNSGGLSFEEYSAMPLMNRIAEERRKKVFDRLDANNDQQISKDEIKQAWPPHRHRGPKNGAGRPQDKPQEKRDLKRGSFGIL